MSDQTGAPPKSRTHRLREQFPEMPQGTTVVFRALHEAILKGLAQDEAAEEKEREATDE